MKLKKCKTHGYTLKETCPNCKNKTQEAHYKFIKVRDAPKNGKTKLR